MIDLSYLPTKTKLIFEKLATTNFIKKFTLVGGTALALQIKHRLSEDLDFIYDGEKIPVNTIKRNIHQLFPNYRIIFQDDNYQIDFIINDSKITFFSTGAIQVSFSVSQNPIHYNNLNIANLENIAILKIASIAQRNTIRDYYDLYFLAKYHLGLEKIIQLAKEKLPHLSPITYSETLIYTEDIPENDISQHLQPKENINKDQIAEFFTKELRRIIHNNKP